MFTQKTFLGYNKHLHTIKTIKNAKAIGLPNLDHRGRYVVSRTQRLRFEAFHWANDLALGDGPKHLAPNSWRTNIPVWAPGRPLRFEDGWGGCQGGLTTEPEEMGQEV